MIRKILALGLVGGLVGLVGCAGGITPVEGVVTLDGKPVDGATVVFAPENGKGQQATGLSDSSGHVRLKTGNKDGVQAGTYKVLVTKVKALTSGTMLPSLKGPDSSGSTDYQKSMDKSMAKGGPPGMPGAGASGGPKSELPEKYGSLDKTPLKVTVPPSEKPVKLELTSK